MELNTLTPSEAFYWMATIAAQTGEPAKPRGLPTHEIHNVTCHINFPHILPVDVYGRNLRHQIGSVEALQLIGQVAAPEVVIGQSKAMADYTDDGIFSGAYGQRIYGQLAACERTLLDDQYTRQAVMTIYDGRQDLLTWNGERALRDIPCTLSLQFFIQKGHLSMRVCMRSNDVWLGLPYDLFQFINLQMAMADALSLPVGGYTHTIGNLHAYDHNIDEINMLRAPSQPERHLEKYEQRFLGDSIGEISYRCRMMLMGILPEDHSQWEHSLFQSLQKRGKKS